MFHYTIMQWLFFFYFYCFFGWCFESAYVSIKERKFVNRGFMKGPFLPIYGCGAIMMYVVSRPFLEHWWAVYLAGCVGATALELITGELMEALFKVRYWDYSDQKWNYKGHICLSSTLAWGGLTLLMAYVIHEPIEEEILAMPSGVLTFLTLALTIYIVSDFVEAFKNAINLRNVLIRMQRRLDVVIAVREDDFSKKKAAIHKELESIIRNNPTISSTHYKEALQELKQELKKKGKGLHF